MSVISKEEAKQSRSGRAQSARSQGSSKAKTVEWVAGGISAAMTLAMIIFLVYQAMTTTTAVPQLLIRIDQLRQSTGAFHVHFRVLNRGNATAAGVLIRGEVRSDGELIEQRRVVLDYVPAQSEAEAALFFKNDPEKYTLELHAEGYREP